MTTLAIITALIASAIADGTRAFSSNSSAGAFSLPLFTNQGRDHTIRRGTDGFLYLQQHSLMASSTANTTNLIRPQVTPHTTSAHFGTGQARQRYTVALDASGFLTWIQCAPCSPAATQTGPVFNPWLSPTFQRMHYTNNICRSPKLIPDPVSKLCRFIINRRSGLSVEGALAVDEYTRSDGIVYPYTVFGCVHRTRRFDNSDTYAGVIGMRPVAMQAAEEHGLTRSSYCLFRETNRQGFIRFGAEADVPRMQHYQTTGLLPVAHDANESAYHVSLVGVSLGRRRLSGVGPETFARRKDGQGGCIVDLGKPLTVMVEAAYRAVEEAVWSDLERHGAERVEQDAYGLCVQAMEAIKGRLQPLSLHFVGEEEEEATLVVSQKKLFLIADDGQAGPVACLAVVPGRRTIIGALQQVDTRFVFDLKENKLSFAPESCIEDTITIA